LPGPPILMVIAASAKVLGPKAAKALAKNAPAVWATVQKTPQGQRLVEKVTDLQRHRKNQIQAQIDLARNAATGELAEQTLPDRQDRCRAWLRSLKVQELALQSAENQARAVARVRRGEVAEATDKILMDIIETIGEWTDGP